MCNTEKVTPDTFFVGNILPVFAESMGLVGEMRSATDGDIAPAEGMHPAGDMVLVEEILSAVAVETAPAGDVFPVAEGSKAETVHIAEQPEENLRRSDRKRRCQGIELRNRDSSYRYLRFTFTDGIMFRSFTSLPHR